MYEPLCCHLYSSRLHYHVLEAKKLITALADSYVVVEVSLALISSLTYTAEERPLILDISPALETCALKTRLYISAQYSAICKSMGWMCCLYCSARSELFLNFYSDSLRSCLLNTQDAGADLRFPGSSAHLLLLSHWFSSLSGCRNVQRDNCRLIEQVLEARTRSLYFLAPLLRYFPSVVT